MNLQRLGLLMASVALVASCGGGGGGSSTPAPTPAAPAPAPSALVPVLCASPSATYNLWTTALAAPGKNIAITVAGCTGAIGNPVWTQTAGPALPLPADRTQTISLDTLVAGSYTFRVDFTDPAGTARSESVSFSVPATVAAVEVLTLRASQSVRMGGKVSVRAWPPTWAASQVESVTWTQLEGPTVTLDTTNPQLALFTAPAVTRDTPIRLRATLRAKDGRTDSDEVLVLVEAKAQAVASDKTAVWAGDHVQRTHAYKAASPWASVLGPCTYDPAMVMTGSAANLCSTRRLPLLAQETGGAVPTIDQVMNRVLVSHDWLGRNFETFLRTQDPQGDFRRMLMSTTAIVLGTQVRPSFYYAVSGAIYLDADNFWLTPEERDTVNEEPDYRSDFASDLKFEGLWRYVKDGKSIFAYFDPTQRITRSTADLGNESSWLLYHELTHALDYTPPGAYASLNPDLSVLANLTPRYNAYQLTSDTLDALYPLRSTEMSSLAQVMYQGATATALEKTYTATQVGGFFAPDLATDDYAYSHVAEDVAMTQEEALMARRLGIRRDVGYVDAGDTDRLVRWGERGRVGQPAIQPRLRHITGALVPWFPASELNLLAAPEPLAVGVPWRSNGVQSVVLRNAQSAGSTAAPDLMTMWQQRKQLQRAVQHRQALLRRLPLQRAAQPLPAPAAAAPKP